MTSENGECRERANTKNGEGTPSNRQSQLQYASVIITNDTVTIRNIPPSVMRITEQHATGIV